ncbi:MAG: oligosaccharide flippase family protein [Burkholderiaceae bacterium]
MSLGRFFRHSGIYAVGNALNWLGAFLLLPLYTRHLSTAQYGTLETFYAVSAVVSGFLSVGIAHATLRFYFEYKEQTDRDALVSTNLIAAAAIGLVGACLFGAFGNGAVQWVLGDVSLPLALPIILATLVLELSSQVCLAYLRARELSIFFISLSFAKLVLQIIANTVLLLKFDAGVEGVLAGNLLAVAFGWLLLTGYTLRRCGLHFQRDKLGPVLRYSLPFLYTTIVAVLAANIDRFMINKLLSLEALGVFALALKFSKLISGLIGEPFNRAYGAFRFTMMGLPDAAAVQARIVRCIAALLCFVGLGLVYFTGDVLHLMSNPQYWPAADLMPLLVLAAIAQLLNYPAQTGILFNKSTGELFKISVVQAIFAVLVGFVLLWKFGLQGACLAAFLSSVLGVVLTHRISQRYFYVAYEYRRLGVMTAIALGFYAASLALAWLPLAYGVAAKLALLGLFVWMLLNSSAFDAQERAWVRQAWFGVWSKLFGLRPALRDGS